MPRTRIELCLLRQLQVGDDLDLVGEGRLAARQRVVPADAELRAVNLGLELQAEAGAAERIVESVDDRADDLDRLAVTLDRDLAVDLQVVAIAIDRLRLEGQLGAALGVEEVGRLEVLFEVLVLDLDRRDLRGALEDTVGHRRIEVRERAGESAGHVVDRKADVGVNLVRRPSSGGYYLGLSGAHCRMPPRAKSGERC